MHSLLKGLGVLTVGVVLGYLIAGTDLGRSARERQAEAMGSLASRYVAAQTELDERAPVQTVAGLNLIDIKVDRFQGNILRQRQHPAHHRRRQHLPRADGGGEPSVRHRPEHTGRQAKTPAAGGGARPGDAHRSLPTPMRTTSGGAKFWRAEFPDAQLIAHAKFPSGQRYLKALEPHFWSRNRLLYPFMPEAPPEGGFAAYGGVQPDLLVADGAAHAFTLGGGAVLRRCRPRARRGEDNLVLWLPQQRALFSGDFFGAAVPHGAQPVHFARREVSGPDCLCCVLGSGS